MYMQQNTTLTLTKRNQTRPVNFVRAVNRFATPWPENFWALVKHSDLKLSDSLTGLELNFSTASDLSKRSRRLVKSLMEFSSEVDIFLTSCVGCGAFYRQLCFIGFKACVNIRLYHRRKINII